MISFNMDGLLLVSVGFDSIGRIWDLWFGRMVMILDGYFDGYIKFIYVFDWGVDGY